MRQLRSWLADINFRVGKFGRFEWTEGGVDYYRQYMPPYLQEQTCSPELMLAQMDHTGVDMALLQNAKVYGKLNDYFAECVRKYPDRFVGLAEITELEADKDSEILKLRHAINDLGLKGIYFEAKRFFEPGISNSFNDKKFDRFWQEISDLGVSVHWAISSSKDSAEVYLEKMRVFDAWAERFPDIASIVVHGLFPIKPFMKNDEVRFPRELLNCFKHPNTFAEILYPCLVGSLGWDYPFPQAQRVIKNLYEEFGAEKLVWGSDMPLTECNCTYKQSLTYLKDYCDFISPKDMDFILGGNAIRILKIESGGSITPRPKLVGGVVM